MFIGKFGINLVNMDLIKPYVKNEWDDLKEIIVGTTKGVQVPTVGDKCLHSIDLKEIYLMNNSKIDHLIHIQTKLWKKWKKI